MKFCSDYNPGKVAIKLGVAVLIEDQSGALLLDLRKDCAMWGLPGGRLEPGESIAQAAVREAREETGLDVELTHLQGVYSQKEGRLVSFNDNEPVKHLVDVAIGAKVKGGKLAVSDESLEISFFPKTGMPPKETICPPARQIIQDYVAGVEGAIR